MKITAIVGSYRKGGVTDTAVDEILTAAAEAGAEVAKIYLIEKHIEFCTNCRTCTQQPGKHPGACPTQDDMRAILEEIERSDALIIASPMNFGTVTAVTKKFIERLICFAYWPWGPAIPKARDKRKTKQAVVVASSSAPAFLARLFSSIIGSMKNAAGLLGAKTIGVLFIGLAAGKPHPDIGARARKKARRLGQKLVAGHRPPSVMT